MPFNDDVMPSAVPAGGALARFTRDLTADARANRLEPVRCRDAEIARVMDILLRHGKNNPVLVGMAGVGKTAIAEGLAQRIARGDLPLALRDQRVLALDHVALLAGTSYRGQYEERIRALVDETTAAHDVILFVDELHNLIGQGTALGAAMDAANMLKPALVRGDFRVIGATTDVEYERWILGDAALERRFQPVRVPELSPQDTLVILEARRERLEAHHNVAIADSALAAAIELTDRYVANRARPDKAIDVLDEACAHAQAIARYSPETERMVQRRIAAARSRRTAPRQTADGQPRAEFDRMARDGMAVLERLGAELEAMFGEQAAAQPVARATEAPAPTPRTDVSTDWNAADDAELRRRLVEEGIVVRGHDIARVVAMATGNTITWAE